MLPVGLLAAEPACEVGAPSAPDSERPPGEALRLSDCDLRVGAGGAGAAPDRQHRSAACGSRRPRAVRSATQTVHAEQGDLAGMILKFLGPGNYRLEPFLQKRTT